MVLKRVRFVRRMRWLATIVSGALLFHVVVVMTTGGRWSIDLAEGWEVGCSGMAFRLYGGLSEGSSIAWDNVDSSFRLELNDGRFCLQFPVLLVMLGSGILACLLLPVERRLRRRTVCLQEKQNQGAFDAESRQL